MADQLATTAQVKARLQSSAGGVTFTAADDTLISELNDQVSDYIQHYTGRRLVAVGSATYILDTTAGYVLRFPLGVRAVSALAINTTAHQPDTGGTYTAVTASNILLRPSPADLPVGWPATEIRLLRGNTQNLIFGTIENGASLTCTAGFATTPPDIAGVAIDAIVAAFQNRKAGASGVIGADGSPVIPWANFFMKGSPQRATLDRYRYPGFG
ncbi:MAG TPA: hypothetical protein VJN72_12585 [Gaiellales bacterium]|nr:hypothetical protein [Gaiellales bacterium]